MNLEPLFKSKWFEVVRGDNYEFTISNPTIAVLPVLISSRSVVVREEYLPCWQYKEPNREKFLTTITGGVEPGEDFESATLREVLEESGITPTKYKLLRGPTSYTGKGTCQTVTPFILLIEEFTQESPTGDGSEFEAKSKAVTLAMTDVDNAKFDDVISYYLLQLLHQLFLNNR